MDFLIASSTENLCELLSEDPTRQLLAGGTDFMVEVNFRHREISGVIAIDRIEELKRWRHDGDSVVIGSCVTYREIERGPLATLIPALVIRPAPSVFVVISTSPISVVCVVLILLIRGPP